MGQPWTLNAFILTPYKDLINPHITQAALESRHVLFMGDGGAVYLPKMFERLGD